MCQLNRQVFSANLYVIVGNKIIRKEHRTLADNRKKFPGK
ncbi:hypothetical protein B4166_1126 [Caldibacillus thermoamylovorans]|uniref:Uncharacterized protein n=1 Tax=Caldibacillus thermoamylovorans TaxID=35841 RepID=A0ABD4A644_9BACI|nr:hypothetical protein B4166_1126 [Caldibacillus thermoamylovorans]KIO72538.1 hypothetical protein B4167_1228 [Caldibacillus thermoamylovorans]